MRRPLTIVIFLILSVMLAQSAMACSCGRRPTAEQILARATAVFTGIAQHNVPVAHQRTITAFKVIEAFKGTAAGARLRVVHRSGPSASCGVKFLPGKSYTLAAYRIDQDPGLVTSLCSTWMFMPQIPHSAQLIERMRELSRKR